MGDSIASREARLTSETEPAFIVESEKSGERAAHKRSALRRLAH
jgi:hypothetical protein